ncbi:hypothetical protein F66182_11135 [Fusarium sp. NRRL 66182]|nr:hypothetical protein F66182_11135 [Fusarium sp. NRRL 66182]
MGDMPSAPPLGPIPANGGDSPVTPPTLTACPLETLYNISSYLTASEMSGAAQASSRLWDAFSRSIFRSVKFQGTQSALVLKLHEFLSIGSQDRRDVINESIRSATITILALDPTDDEYSQTHYMLPNLIIRSISRMSRVSTIFLDTLDFSRNQERSFRRQLSNMSAWTSIQNLRMRVRSGSVERLIANCASEKLKAVHIEEKLSYNQYQEIGRHCQPLKRLSIWVHNYGFEYNYHSLSLRQLEWLIIAPKPEQGMGTPLIFVTMVRSIVEKETQKLAGNLGKYPHLRRVGFWFSSFTSGWPHFVNQNIPGVNLLTLDKKDRVFGVIRDLSSGLPNLQELCFVETLAGNQSPVIYRGTRAAEGEDMTVDLKQDCHRDAFPLGLLY